jgi:hypothetical protein
MNVHIGTVAAQFLFWEYLFRIFGIGSLQCGVKPIHADIERSYTCPRLMLSRAVQGIPWVLTTLANGDDLDLCTCLE